MIALMQAVQTALINAGYFESVYLSEMVHEEGDAMPPASAKLPAAGVYDAGEDEPEDQASSGLLRKIDLQVVIYAPADGRGKAGLESCLQLAEQTRALLHRNLLGVPGVILASYRGAGGTRLEALRANHAVRKVLNFYYELEE